EEFLYGHAAVGRHPDDADGRRGPPHAARQQQRVLPRRRDQLVRLDAARCARRRPSFRAAAVRPTDTARRGRRAPAPWPDRDADGSAVIAARGHYFGAGAAARPSTSILVVSSTEWPSRISGHIARKRPSGVVTRPK